MSTTDNTVNIRIVNFCNKPKSDSANNGTVGTSPEEKQRPSNKKRKSESQPDIFDIHAKILNRFEEEYTQLPEYKSKLKKLEWILENSDNDDEICLAKQEAQKLTRQINTIELGIQEARYLHRTEKILERYNELVNMPVKIDFMTNSKNQTKDEKQLLKLQYTNIAKEYIAIDPCDPVPPKILTCDDCQVELQREDDFLFVCPSCGFSIKHFASMASYQENTRINVSQRYVYEKRAHFGDSIKKFQAKQNTTISNTVYKDLWNKLQAHDIPIEKVTKEHIYEFLKLTGHSDHYEDITLIYCEMTGKPAPNISHLEQKLFELFDQIDAVYERVKPPNRANFLNGQYVLFKLLQKLKYKFCNENDFYILKTRDKMLEHDQIWKKICEELCWTYIPIV